MSKTIEGVPDFLTREQYISIFEAVGVDPTQVVEMRMAHDGVHALVVALHSDGNRIIDPHGQSYQKHRVFIPVRRDETDIRTTRTTSISNN